MSACIFCAVARGEADRSLVYEDDNSVVVMDIQPVNQGHTLVLPKRHAASLADLDDRLAGELFVTTLRTAEAVRRSGVRCQGVNLFVADGEAAGQEVAHLHLHVIPRFQGDPFRIDREGGWPEPVERDELDRVAEAVRGAWK